MHSTTTQSIQRTLIGADKHTSKPLTWLIGVFMSLQKRIENVLYREKTTYYNIELQNMSYNGKQIAYLRIFPKSSESPAFTLANKLASTKAKVKVKKCHPDNILYFVCKFLDDSI